MHVCTAVHVKRKIVYIEGWCMYSQLLILQEYCCDFKPSGPLIYRLKYFRTRSWIRRDICMCKKLHSVIDTLELSCVKNVVYNFAKFFSNLKRQFHEMFDTILFLIIFQFRPRSWARTFLYRSSRFWRHFLVIFEIK